MPGNDIGDTLLRCRMADNGKQLYQANNAHETHRVMCMTTRLQDHVHRRARALQALRSPALACIQQGCKPPVIRNFGIRSHATHKEVHALAAPTSSCRWSRQGRGSSGSGTEGLERENVIKTPTGDAGQTAHGGSLDPPLHTPRLPPPQDITQAHPRHSSRFVLLPSRAPGKSHTSLESIAAARRKPVRIPGSFDSTQLNPSVKQAPSAGSYDIIYGPKTY